MRKSGESSAGKGLKIPNICGSYKGPKSQSVLREECSSNIRIAGKFLACLIPAPSNSGGHDNQYRNIGKEPNFTRLAAYTRKLLVLT